MSQNILTKQQFFKCVPADFLQNLLRFVKQHSKKYSNIKNVLLVPINDTSCETIIDFLVCQDMIVELPNINQNRLFEFTKLMPDISSLIRAVKLEMVRRIEIKQHLIKAGIV